MRRLAAGIFGLALVACQPPTPAQEGAIVRSAVDAGRAACLVAKAKSLPLTPAQVTWCDCQR